ncbi:MAG TPA: calcium-binding protein [Candidatus Lokiarchaeia archaeon]|nr:calcium-binding protein [Candidatus Lokiarchaeia archaeon]
MGQQGITRKQKQPERKYSPEELDAIAEDATIDSYGDDEELCSWAVYLEDELVFPFPFKIVGKTVQAVGIMEYDGMIKLKVKSESKIYKVNILDVEIVINPGEKNRNDLLIQAFRHWFSPGEHDDDRDVDFI